MRRSPLALLIAIIVVVAAAGQAIALTGPADTQANQPQVANKPMSNTTARFPTNKQNEPTIALYDSYALAGANDEQNQPPCGPGPVRGPTAAANNCSFFPDVGTSGVYASSDTGTTWTNLGMLPGYSDTTNTAPSAGPLATSATRGTLVSDGDPVIVFGPKLGSDGKFTFAAGARAYYANLAAYSTAGRPGNQQAELIAVSISDDYGASWFDPVVAAKSSGNVFNDKEDIWVDRNESSPYFGRVYATYTEFRSLPGTSEPIILVWSGDGGLTWSKQNQISSAYNNATRGGRQGSVVRTGADGSVYVTFEDGDNKIGSQHVIVVSHDGGVSFSKKTTISTVTDLAAAIPGSNFRTNSFSSMAIDQRPTNGAIYVAWSDARSGAGRIVVSTSRDAGQTWSAPLAVSTAAEGYAFSQGIDVAPTGRIDIGYQALRRLTTARYGTGAAAIDSYYVSSPNGTSWSAPLKVSSASSDPAASAQNNLALQFWGDYNTLVSTNDTALFIYTDSRSGAGCPAVDAYQHGLDGSGPSVAKPAPGNDCPAQFGNSDAYVSKITP